MSEFKFTCPSCGQKIACESSYAGVQIVCPACQKALTVPTVSGASAVLVSTAHAAPVAQSAARPAPIASTAAAPLPAPAPAKAPPPAGQRPLPMPEELAKAAAASAAAAKPVEKLPETGYCSLAIISLISSVILVIGWLPGIICGHLAKKRIRRNPLLDGAGLASAGLFISYASLVLMLGTGTCLALLVRSGTPILARRESPEALAALQPRIVDEINTSDFAAEQAHHLVSQRSGNTRFGTNMTRVASQGGYFRYTMKVLPTEQMSVNLRYYGSDSGRRIFDIAVDDQIVGTQVLEYTDPGHIFDVEYKIPRYLTKGKHEATVTVAAHPGMTAGIVFDIAMLKK